MIINRKNERKQKRKLKIRKKIRGSAEVPRISFYRSDRSLYVQLIDDEKGVTLCSASVRSAKNKEAAKRLGGDFLGKVKALKLEGAVLDRNGYRYHGVIKEFADTLREGGLKF